MKCDQCGKGEGSRRYYSINEYPLMGIATTMETICDDCDKTVKEAHCKLMSQATYDYQKWLLEWVKEAPNA